MPRQSVKNYRQEIIRNGFTMIEIIGVVTVIALLSALTIVNVVRVMRVARDDAAINNLQTISIAFSDYASQNSGKYPTSETQLTSTNPPYLAKSFCGTTNNGFIYSCDLDQSAYRVTARYAKAIFASNEKMGYYVDQSGKVQELAGLTIAGSSSCLMANTTNP